MPIQRPIRFAASDLQTKNVIVYCLVWAVDGMVEWPLSGGKQEKEGKYRPQCYIGSVVIPGTEPEVSQYEVRV